MAKPLGGVSSNFKPALLVLFLLVLLLVEDNDGFADALVASTTVSINSNNKIHVSPVSSAKDLVDLGNLRYSEWMLDLGPKDRPSRMAFRMATAECQQERMEQNAVAFLARSSSSSSSSLGNHHHHDDDDGVGEVIGTAELSCIELKDCYYNDDSPESISHYFYVTDVVTARTHRRQGVAATLMDALEQHALNIGKASTIEKENNPSPVLLLHVEHDNKSALAFYKALGYQIVQDDDDDDDGRGNKLEGLNVDRLSENAGVSGQLLLSKTLVGTGKVGEAIATTASTKKSKNKKKSRRNSSGGGFGFSK